jgi:UDP-3-O-[3-hydroxymyristoyl] glucosamine N-acyltransferase
VVGNAVVIGADTRLLSRVTLCTGTRIGARGILHPGAVVGSDGFGNARDGEAWIKVPQVGGVSIGDDVEIGANTTIDRGALGDTVIEDGVRLDNQIQVAHNVSIGAHTAIAACTGIAGSTRIGRRCMIGGGTGIGGQLTLGDDIIIAGFGMVSRSIDKPGLYSSVIPVEEARLWRRIVGGSSGWTCWPRVSGSWRTWPGSARQGRTMTTEKPFMDIYSILKYLPHRYPFLLVDRVLECKG